MKNKQRRNHNLSTQHNRNQYHFSNHFSAQVSTKYKQDSSLSPHGTKSKQMQMLSILNDSKLEKLVLKKDAQTSSMKPFH